MTKRLHPTKVLPFCGYTTPVDLWCVVYRIGGPDSFKWYRAIGYDEVQVVKVSEDMLLNGFVSFTYVERQTLSLAIGLPTTFLPCEIIKELES